MTVTIDAPEYVNLNTIRLTWSSDQPSPTYSVFVDGALVIQTELEEYLLNIALNGSPLIEITDDGSGPSTAWPQRLVLAWRSVLDTDVYRIERFIDAAWVVRAKETATENRHYSWTTDVLDDGETYQYRIVPEGTNGNDGTPVSFVVVMVRVPAPPAAGWVYDSGTGTLTVTATGA